MRGGKSFLVLLVLALGLGAYIFFVESKREPAGDTAAVKKAKAFTTDSSKFEQIEVKAESGDTTILRKKDGLWEITAPETMPADSTEVGNLVSSLESLEIQSVIDENPNAISVKDKEGRSPMVWAEGVFLATHPSKPKPSSIALLKELLAAPAAPQVAAQ